MRVPRVLPLALTVTCLEAPFGGQQRGAQGVIVRQGILHLLYAKAEDLGHGRRIAIEDIGGIIDIDTQRIQRLVKIALIRLIDDKVVDKAAGIADQRLTLSFGTQAQIGIDHRGIAAIATYLPLELRGAGFQRRLHRLAQIGGQGAIGQHRFEGIDQRRDGDAIGGIEVPIGKGGGQVRQHLLDR